MNPMTDAQREADAFIRGWAIANVINTIGINAVVGEEPIR